MALVSHRTLWIRRNFAAPFNHRNPLGCVERGNQGVICCKSGKEDKKSWLLTQQQHQGAATRREAMFGMSSIALVFPGVVSSATARSTNDAAEGFRVYTDQGNKFKILIPQEWQVGEADSSGFKSVTAFYPRETSTSNVSVVITGVGPDFTTMESFGKVEAFAETLVGGLDRSWQRPPGVAAKLIRCKATKGLYYIDYSLQNPGESRKYLCTALGMAFNGWYNRLYTVTGQFMEEEAQKFGSKIEKAVASFVFL